MKKLLAFSLVALAACQRGESPKADSALTADLALASQMQAARPNLTFQDSAAQVATAPAPAPTPEPRRTATHIENAPRVRTIPRQTTQPVVTQPVAQAPQPQRQQAPSPEPAAARGPAPGFGAGASFSLASQQRMCSSSNRPGDRFVATVTNTISGNGGASIPAGSNVVLEVASVSDQGMTFTVNSVELNGRNYPASGDVESLGQMEKVRVNGSSDAKKVAGGAIAGALIGQLMKKNTKGTVIGAAAGAATGAVAAKMTEKYETCLPAGAPMRLTLSNALLM